MSLDWKEVAADVPEALALVGAVKDAVSKLPAAADRKPSDFLNLASLILSAAGPLADKVAEQAKS